MLKQLISFSIIGASLLTNLQLTQAQQSDRFLRVGTTQDGTSIYIDSQSVRGNNFDLYQGYGGGIIKISIQLNCAYRQAFQTRYTLYDEKHNVVDDRTNVEPLEMAEGSALAYSFKYVCARN